MKYAFTMEMPYNTPSMLFRRREDFRMRKRIFDRAKERNSFNIAMQKAPMIAKAYFEAESTFHPEEEKIYFEISRAKGKGNYLGKGKGCMSCAVRQQTGILSASLSLLAAHPSSKLQREKKK
jgi:hypothetical protein